MKLQELAYLAGYGFKTLVLRQRNPFIVFSRRFLSGGFMTSPGVVPFVVKYSRITQ